LATSDIPPAGSPDDVGQGEAHLHIDGIAMVRLLGPQDRLLTTIERQYPLVNVLVRGNEITLTGDAAQVDAVRRLVEELLVMVRNGQEIGTVEVTSSARMIDSNSGLSPADVLSQAILTSRGKSIRPKTLGQKTYVDAIDENPIVFGIGPAGTGKTYLAMAKAVQALQRKEVSRIILTRPAV
jgi:phosphate starvation-inducible PhoH-like protein